VFIMMRCFFIVIVSLATVPLFAQNNYPSTPLAMQPLPAQPGPPPLASASPQPFGQLSAPTGPIYAPAPIPAPAPMPQRDSTQYQYQVVPATAPATVAPPVIDQFRESTWYTRIDYYHWNERLDGADFVNEDGALATLGYEHRTGVERYRGELFGSTVNYAGSAQFPDGSSDPLHSTTKYLGLRAEYDLLIEPEGLLQVSFFAGLGTRFWIRDMKDDVSDNGFLVQGYQETWWTIYPYLGIERRRTHTDDIEFYYSARIGCTPITYQRVVDFDTTLYPKCGLTGQLEAGLRGRRFLLSACFEGMGWSQSEVVRDSLQPASSFLTVGIKAGYCF
jgi:hypothetical protein